MNFIEYILDRKHNWIINIKIIPNAKKNEFVELLPNGVIKIKISAIPEKWKANIELIKFLSDKLRLKKDSICIISWVTSQIKKIKLDI
jgi:uncharacterized protein (TIGR00251 family)